MPNQTKRHEKTDYYNLGFGDEGHLGHYLGNDDYLENLEPPEENPKEENLTGEVAYGNTLEDSDQETKDYKR